MAKYFFELLLAKAPLVSANYEATNIATFSPLVYFRTMMGNGKAEQLPHFYPRGNSVLCSSASVVLKRQVPQTGKTY